MKGNGVRFFVIMGKEWFGFLGGRIVILCLLFYFFDEFVCFFENV